MRKKFSGSSQMLLRMWSVWKNFASMSCRMVFLESRSPYANQAIVKNMSLRLPKWSLMKSLKDPAYVRWPKRPPPNFARACVLATSMGCGAGLRRGASAGGFPGNKRLSRPCVPSDVSYETHSLTTDT